MKTIVLTLCLIVFASLALANGNLNTSNNGSIIQGCDFDGTEAVALTVNSLTKDNTDYACFAIYSPADCYIRLTETASKAGSVRLPIPGGSYQTFVVNKKAPFAQPSSCTNGFFIRNSQKLP